VFDITSRYYLIETATYVAPDGRELAYKRRRFLPPAASMPQLGEVVVVQEDRLDLVTARSLGVPEAFWRVADANEAMNPFELTLRPGRRLIVPQPQP
jgi:hypothetical protein